MKTQLVKNSPLLALILALLTTASLKSVAVKESLVPSWPQVIDRTLHKNVHPLLKLKTPNRNPVRI